MGAGGVATSVPQAPQGIILSHSIGDIGFVAHVPAVNVNAVSPGISQEVDDLFDPGQHSAAGGNSGPGTFDSPESSAHTLVTPNAGVVVGDPTDVTPGNSIQFSSLLPSSGSDALFQGTKYTDYHMALQTGASSASPNLSAPAIMAPAVEPSSPAHSDNTLAHSDNSTATQPLQLAEAQHQDPTPIHSLSVHLH
jgi:hypothetical protein